MHACMYMKIKTNAIRLACMYVYETYVHTQTHALRLARMYVYQIQGGEEP